MTHSKLFWLGALLCGFQSQSQDLDLLVKLKDGSSSRNALNEVRRLTHTTSDLVLIKKDNTNISWSLSSISSITHVPAITTGIQDAAAALSLFSVYPNPVVDQLHISYITTEAGLVAIELLNIDGRVVQQILTSEQPAGKHSVTFPTEGLTQGLFVVRVLTPTQISSQKITIN